MPYYFSLEPESLKSKLEYCQHTWLRERKGDDIRWRGIGCGERDVCPVCGSYRQLVPARDTSQLCSRCGARVPKDLSVRVHSCPSCGLSIDRDINAALNILSLGQRLRDIPAQVPRIPAL